MIRLTLLVVVGLLLISACTDLENETLSTEEMEHLSTAMAIPFQEPSDAENVPLVICYGDFEGEAWGAVSDLTQAIADNWSASVVVMEADAVMLEGEPSFENLELESLPACLLFDSTQEEVSRVYDDFTLETFSELISEMLGE